MDVAADLRSVTFRDTVEAEKRGLQSARPRVRDFAMDADRLRAAFIKGQLERVLKHRHTSWAARATQELGRYIRWFADSIPQSEKKTIDEQLSKLEREVSKRD